MILTKCHNQINDDFALIQEENEVAVKALKNGKSAGVTTKTVKLIKARGEYMVNALTVICNKMIMKKRPTPMTQSLVITIPKKGDLQLSQKHQMISLISQPSKVLLKVLLNRLQPQVEETFTQEQAGFRAGRRTIEQIFNLQFFLNNTYNTNMNCTTFSLILIMHLIWFDMMPYGQL